MYCDAIIYGMIALQLLILGLNVHGQPGQAPSGNYCNLPTLFFCYLGLMRLAASCCFLLHFPSKGVRVPGVEDYRARNGRVGA